MTEAPGILSASGTGGRIGEPAMWRFAGRLDVVVGFDREAPPPAPPGCIY